ncbi:MAG TPA: 3-oxoacyl-ACP reductase FabG [Longimicrobiales bacterium]|nr:3-oxoacyl-ACP reductase FabG [Longimicrobiales bacterium]
MDLGLAGKVALVTGGAGGIGAAIVHALLAERCEVAVLDRSHRSTALTDPRPRPALMLAADVRDYERAPGVVEHVVTHFGGLDILVCCAGIAQDGVSWKMTESAWDDVLAVNLKGCFNYAHAAVPALRARGGGRIVNIASINGLRGKFGQANYAASKAGMIGLSKTLARELGAFDITVNVVAPGMTVTAMTHELAADTLAAALEETVLGRLCTPDDIASAVVFLCSDRARQITGEVVRVDAGQYI